MADLHKLLRQSGAGLSRLHTPRICRVRHGDTTLRFDFDNAVGVVLNLTEAHHARSFADGRVVSAQPRVGALTILPPGRPTKLMLEGTATVLFLQISLAELSEGAEAHDVHTGHVELLPRLAFLDPVLASRLYAASGGVQDEGEALRLIVARLLQAHATRSCQTGAARGGLSPARLRKVRDRIEAGLDEAITLPDLAAEAGVSVFHFAREFRRVTGMAPHRYILQRRLGRAIVMLSNARLRVSSIAAATGFADASHLARHLRRTTGMAPDVFRSRILLAK